LALYVTTYFTTLALPIGPNKIKLILGNFLIGLLNWNQIFKEQ